MYWKQVFWKIVEILFFGKIFDFWRLFFENSEIFIFTLSPKNRIFSNFRVFDFLQYLHNFAIFYFLVVHDVLEPIVQFGCKSVYTGDRMYIIAVKAKIF